MSHLFIRNSEMWCICLSILFWPGDGSGKLSYRLGHFLQQLCQMGYLSLFHLLCVPVTIVSPVGLQSIVFIILV